MKIKNKVLLLSLLSMLGLTSCSKNTIDSFEPSYKETTTDDNIDLEETAEDVSISSEENLVQEEIIDSKEEVMDLIDSGCIKKIYYATEDINLTIPDYLTDSGMEEIVVLPKLECLEVYNEVEDVCLVKTNEYVGYVNTTSLEELTGNFVVVDISSQKLKLYSNNEVVLTVPVVTGKPSTSPTDEGLFEIYNISGPRYLVGPNYRSFVDIMMKYNGGEGLHDAEYHQHDDGFNHGWRDKSEFGGETYLTDGSHGCVNMMREDVMTVREYVDLGTKVLVKK